MKDIQGGKKRDAARGHVVSHMTSLECFGDFDKKDLGGVTSGFPRLRAHVSLEKTLSCLYVRW